MSAPAPCFFEEPLIADAVHREFTCLISKLLNERIEQMISKRNRYRLRHGESWVQTVDDRRDSSQMKGHSAEFSIDQKDIQSGNIQVVPAAIESLVNDMHRNFVCSVYQTVSDACDQSGNVVSAQALGSTEAALLEMLDTVQYGVDERGNVSLPEVHCAPEAYEKIQEAIIKGGERLRVRVEEIKARKSAEALQIEARRREKFIGYGEP